MTYLHLCRFLSSAGAIAAAAAFAQPVPLPFTPEQITAKWTFGGKRDPENKTGPAAAKISANDTPITIAFSENVTVKGHLRLALRNGAFADYTSGGGTDMLIFTAPARPELVEQAANATAAKFDFNGGAIVTSEASATLRFASEALR